jgi:hypothetical protein
MPDIRILDPLTFPDYDALLTATPGHSIFHCSLWARVLHETYGYRPVYFASVNRSGFHGLMPMAEVKSILTGLRGVSLPFTDSCEPIADDRPASEELARTVMEHGRTTGWRSVEWRGAKGQKADAPPSQVFCGHRLTLAEDEDRMVAGFRDSTRRNIRKARKGGVTVRIEDSWEAVRAFYRLNCLTRREHGLPPQPLSFFRGLHRHVISGGHGFVALGDHDGRAIAGAVFLHFGQEAVYKYGASDRAHQGLRANNLVMWEGIRRCGRLGCTALSMGRTEAHNQGLLRFKAGWGTREETISYFKFDLRTSTFVQERSRVEGWHNKVFARLPLPASRLIGALLYRHMG